MIKRQEKKFSVNKNRGQVMLVVVVLFMSVSLIIILGVINPTLRNIKVASDLFKSKQSLILSDSGVADVIYRIKNNLQISSQKLLLLDGQTATTSITDTIEGKTINSVSNYLDYVRNIEAKIIKGTGASFFYGVQTGDGGFTMSGNSQVNGNIYSNGSISGGTVTGSAISAGPTGSISDVNVGQAGVGDAYAHTVNDSTVQGALKCKIGSGNNKVCNTSFDDPTPVEMPISDGQVADWKAEIEALPENIIIGDYSPSDPVTLGPVKITGDFNVKNIVTMTGTIWVEGVLSFGNTQAKIVLATSTYGSKSGVIIVDKYVNFSGGSQIMSTGITGSFVMLLVTSDCPISSFCSGKSAISASGNAGSVVLAAPYGTVSFGGNSSAKEVVAEKIIAGGSATIDYEVGLANLNFVSGPSGSYHVASFRETE